MRSFEIPLTHMELFSLVLGVDSFLADAAAARWLDVNTDTLLNHNSIRSVWDLIPIPHRVKCPPFEPSIDFTTPSTPSMEVMGLNIDHCEGPLVCVHL